MHELIDSALLTALDAAPSAQVARELSEVRRDLTAGHDLSVQQKRLLLRALDAVISGLQLSAEHFAERLGALGALTLVRAAVAASLQRPLARLSA